MPILILCLCLAVVGYSIINIQQNQKLAKRQKVNLTFFVLIIPVIGSFVYFIYNSFWKKQL
jgi:hypothetical protein